MQDSINTNHVQFDNILKVQKSNIIYHEQVILPSVLPFCSRYAKLTLRPSYVHFWKKN